MTRQLTIEYCILNPLFTSTKCVCPILRMEVNKDFTASVRKRKSDFARSWKPRGCRLSLETKILMKPGKLYIIQQTFRQTFYCQSDFLTCELPFQYWLYCDRNKHCVKKVIGCSFTIKSADFSVLCVWKNVLSLEIDSKIKCIVLFYWLWFSSKIQNNIWNSFITIIEILILAHKIFPIVSCFMLLLLLIELSRISHLSTWFSSLCCLYNWKLGMMTYLMIFSLCSVHWYFLYCFDSFAAHFDTCFS